MNSSTTRGMRWISSMNRTEPSSKLVKNGSKSAGLARAGPLVIWIEVPSSLGSTVAKVVLPRPGGPSNRMWPSGSLSFFEARTAISRRAATRLHVHLRGLLRGIDGDRPLVLLLAVAGGVLAAVADLELDYPLEFIADVLAAEFGLVDVPLADHGLEVGGNGLVVRCGRG